MDSKWKKIAIIETAVVVIAVIFVAGIFIGKRSSNSTAGSASETVTQQTESSDSGKNDTMDNSTAQETQNTQQTEAASSSDSKSSVFTISEELNDLEATFELTTQWGDSSMYYYSYTLILENKGDADIEDWGIIVQVPDDFDMSSAWNTEWEVSDGMLYLLPVDFNKQIAAKSKVESAGFIAMSKEEIDFSTASVGVPNAAEADSNDKDADTAGTKNSSQTGSNSKENNASSGKTGNSKSGAASADEIVTTKAEYYGKLTVKGTALTDASGNAVQLHGVSTHGLAWYPEYVNYDSFKTLRDNYNVNLIRLAMYTDESGGYCTDGDKDSLKKLIDKGVGYASDLDMYVIIDWHILNDGDPNTYKSQAKEFFAEMSKKYADYDNVIYEICNEPNGQATWSGVKSYAEEIISTIRKNDKDAVILVGTTTWSQDVDQAAKDPITGYDNIMYTMHFYAASHKEDLRNKLTSAISSGLPVFISEFSICDASGNGTIDYDSANAWLELINDNNISCVAWSLCNKNEASALLKSSSTVKDDYTSSDLSDTGLWVFKAFTN